MITLKRFRKLEQAVRTAGYADAINWTESVAAPANAEAFAEQAIYVICNSGMSNHVALGIYKRCIDAFAEGQPATSVFGHPGKASAIDQIWEQREALFSGFAAAENKLEFCASLPWIGPVTKFHLGKNFGLDTAKPDVHMERLARRDRCSTHSLCRCLAKQTGYRVATIDTILWRACADGFLSSSTYEEHGWRAAYYRGSRRSVAKGPTGSLPE